MEDSLCSFLPTIEALSPSLIFSFLLLDVVGGGEADPCSPNPCKNGGTCQNVGGTYKCTCAAGFIGPTCAGMLIFLKRLSFAICLNCVDCFLILPLTSMLIYFLSSHGIMSCMAALLRLSTRFSLYFSYYTLLFFHSVFDVIAHLLPFFSRHNELDDDPPETEY